MLRLVTLIDGYGCVRRGTIALHWSSRLLLRSLRIRVVSSGVLRGGPSLVVANGESWLDVVVLAAAGPMRPVLAPDHLQVALFGAGARRAGALCGALDTGRQRQDRQSGAAVAGITEALRRGHRVLTFPCSVPPGGRPASPLRVGGAVIQAAVDAAAVVAPVAIRRPIPIDGSPAAACALGDVVTGLWRILRAGSSTIEVRWLPVIPAIVAQGHPSRHRARTADRVARAINSALAGTGVPPPDLLSRTTATPATATCLAEPRSRTVSMSRLERSA